MRNLLWRRPWEKEQPKDEAPEAQAVAPVELIAPVMIADVPVLPAVPVFLEPVENPLEGMKRSAELDLACQAMVREVVKEKAFEHVEVWRLVDGSILIRRREA